MLRRIGSVALFGLLVGCGLLQPAAERRVRPENLEGWDEAELLPAAEAFRRSCPYLTSRPQPFGSGAAWSALCAEAEAVSTEEEARVFFEAGFDALILEGGGALVTGYFEPVFPASPQPQDPFTAPVLATPPDLVSVDLGLFREDLKGRRIAGRVEDGRLVPYDDRATIDAAPPANAEILGYMTPDDLFFLQVQGSGVLVFEDGAQRIGYAAQNGHPYTAIGRVLVEEGHMDLGEVTMQSIRAWLEAAHPDDAARIRASNASYVFFADRGPAEGSEGPSGTAGVPLAPMVSVAVDATVVPLGAPVFLRGEDQVLALSHLAVAQDTGGAIKGAGRADLFLGRGDGAGEIAGKLKLDGFMAVLVPRAAGPGA